MSSGGVYNELGPLTRRWEFFPLEYMAKMATTGDTDDLCEGLGPRFVFLSVNGSRDSYTAGWRLVQRWTAMR